MYIVHHSDILRYTGRTSPGTLVGHPQLHCQDILRYTGRTSLVHWQDILRYTGSRYTWDLR